MALTNLYLVFRHDDDGVDVLVGAVKNENEMLELVVDRERPAFLKTLKCSCRGESHLHNDDFESHIRRVISKYRMQLP